MTKTEVSTKDLLDKWVYSLILSKLTNLISQAVDAEFTAFIDQYSELSLENQRRRIVRNGYLPRREFQTLLGSVSLCVPRSKDKCAKASDRSIRFTSKIVRPYRRSANITPRLVSYLYIRGLLSGSFSDVLAALTEKQNYCLSDSALQILQEEWQLESLLWKGRSFENRQYQNFEVCSIYPEDEVCEYLDKKSTCHVIVVGCTEGGEKDLIACLPEDKSTGTLWTQPLLELKGRGISNSAMLEIFSKLQDFQCARCDKAF